VREGESTLQVELGEGILRFQMGRTPVLFTRSNAFAHLSADK
jgi:hypothetical protein